MYRLQIKAEKDFVLRVAGQDCPLEAGKWSQVAEGQTQKEVEEASAVALDQMSDLYAGSAEYRLVDNTQRVLRKGAVS